MEPVTLGVDLGRSEIRLFDGEAPIHYPALAGGPVRSIARGSSRHVEDHPQDTMTVRAGRLTHTLGRLALEQPMVFPASGVDLFEDELAFVHLLGALGLAARHHRAQGTFRVRLGLAVPQIHARREAELEASLDAWRGVHRYEFCGQPVAVAIDQIDVLPRTLAAVYAATMDSVIDPGPDTTLGVIDAGHVATDWMVARLPRELPRFGGFTQAVAGIRLVEAVEEVLRDAGVVRIDPMAALEASLDGVYVDGRVRVEMPEGLLDEILELMAQQLALTLRQAWRDLSVDQVLLTGGLGARLAPWLEGHKALPGLVVAAEPRHSVVQGAYHFEFRQPGPESAAPVEA
ncbi:MAG: hypothetical protein FJY99_10075 [Candidatus Sericytochromatia bacterium]|nr:hypothetical protein [Candidatus Tanganyikabacteria bacterium]